MSDILEDTFTTGLFDRNSLYNFHTTQGAVLANQQVIKELSFYFAGVVLVTQSHRFSYYGKDNETLNIVMRNITHWVKVGEIPQA